MGDRVYPADLDEGAALANALEAALIGVQWGPGPQDVLDAAQVHAVWADPEEELDRLPALAVAPLDVTPDYHGFVPLLLDDTRRPIMAGPALALVKLGEARGTAELKVWARDQEQRGMLLLAIQTALLDVTLARVQRRIDVPRYFGGVEAVVEVRGVQYLDTAEDVQQGYRKAVIQVAFQMPIVRPVPVAPLAARFALQVGG